MTPRQMLRRTRIRGGGTFPEPKSGYAVALVDGTYALVDRDDVAGFAKAVARIRAEFPGAAIGTWLQGDVVHVDPVEIIPTESRALQAARERHQLAFWSFADQREIAA